MAQPFARLRLRNNVIVSPGLESSQRGCLHTHWAVIYDRSWCGSGPPGTGHTSCHRSHQPSLWPNRKTFESGSSVSYAASWAAFPRICLCSGINPGRDPSRISLPVVAFSASHGLQQLLPEKRSVRPNRSEGNGSRKSRWQHGVGWVMLTEHLGYHTCNQGKLRAGRDGGGAGDPRSSDAKAGKRERGWWEVRRDGEDEEGWGVQVCDVGMGRGSGEERSSIWRETRKEVAGVRQRGQRWSTPRTAGCPALSNCSERDFWQSWDSILSFWWQN